MSQVFTHCDTLGDTFSESGNSQCLVWSNAKLVRGTLSELMSALRGIWGQQHRGLHVTQICVCLLAEIYESRR